MQVSPPINTESPETIPLEGTGAKIIPKDKLGVFAKLLEGLIRHTKTGKAGEALTEESEAPEGLGDLKNLLNLEDPAILQNFTGLEDPEGLTFKDLEGKAGADKRAPVRGKGPSPAAEKALRGKSAGESPPPPKAGPPPVGEADPALTAVSPPDSAAALAEGPRDPLPPEAGETLEAALLTGEQGPQGTENPFLAGDLEQDQGDRKAGEDRKVRGLPELSGAEGRSGPARPALERAPADQGAGADRVNSRRNDPREKRRERLSLEVRDYRQSPTPEIPGQGPSGAGPTNSREVELRVELPRMEFAREGFAESGSSPASSAGEAAAGNFESLLSGELRGALGQDILRQATLILRDGGEGLIRLALKPESLGTVKIRLEMAENKVSGRIIVESDEVLRAFERELQTLEQAFKDSGFDGASIEMAISSGGGGDPRERQEPEAEGSFQGRRLLRLAAADYDSTAVQAPEDLFDEAGIFGSSRRPVNMLV